MTRFFSLVFSHASLFIVWSRHLFLWWTHSQLRLFPLFLYPLSLMLVGYDCAYFLYYHTTELLLSYLWYQDYLTYAFLNHNNSTFFHGYVFLQNLSHSIYLVHHLHFHSIFVRYFYHLLFSTLNFTLWITSTASYSVIGYWQFLIAYWMEKSCINYPYFLLSVPIMKSITNDSSYAFFFVLIISSVSFTSSSFLNSLVFLTKLPRKIQSNFSRCSSLV